MKKDIQRNHTHDSLLVFGPHLASYSITNCPCDLRLVRLQSIIQRTVAKAVNLESDPNLVTVVDSLNILGEDKVVQGIHTVRIDSSVKHFIIHIFESCCIDSPIRSQAVSHEPHYTIEIQVLFAANLQRVIGKEVFASQVWRFNALKDTYRVNFCLQNYLFINEGPRPMFVCVRDICENVCFGDNCLKININNDDSSPVIIKGYGGVIKNFELCTPIMRSPLDSQDLLLG